MKRNAPRAALLALLFGAAAPLASANSALTVHVVGPSGSPVASAEVVALYFNNGNPDPTASQLGQTDATGTASFTTLTDSDVYQVVVASEGYAPSIVDQFNAGSAPSFTANPASSATVTIAFSTAGVGGVGEIDVPVSGASGSTILFGQVGLQAGGGAVAYGAMLTSGGGAGTLRFFNVGYANGGTYQVSAFDRVKNVSQSAPIGSGFFASPFVGPPLSFTNAPPPVTNISQSQQNGANGALSVYGVMTDTQGATIPYVWFNFSAQYKDQYGQTHNDWRGANTDQNGVFQLFGLLPGVTYYASIPAVCNGMNGRCYQASPSTAAIAGFGSAPGVNDFLYTSTSTVLNQTITLQQMPPSTGALAIYVKDQFGNPFPQASIGLMPDYRQWQIGGASPTCGGPFASNAGMSSLNLNNTTGYALVTGLASGNYSISVWTPFGQTQFNAGADGQINTSSGSCLGSDADDLRVTIDTTSGNPAIDAGVYDAYGAIVSTGNASITVTVSVSTSSSGLVTGSIAFPSATGSTVDLSSSPISIVLYPQCNNGGSCPSSGGFIAFNSKTQPTSPQTYSIPVSSGVNYWMNVNSAYWGAIYPGGNQPQPNLTSTSTAVVNLQFLPAGRIRGFLRKPDGSVYVPPTSSGGNNLWINANGGSAWGGGQVLADGSFVIGGVVPGAYTLTVNSNGGSFPYATRVPLPTVNVQASQDSTIDVYLDNAVDVKPLISTNSLPAMGLVACPQNATGDCPPENWKIDALPAGTPFTGATATNLLAHGGGDIPNVFEFSPSTGQVNNGSCNGQFLASPGFCYKPLSVSGSAGSAYDLYLMRAGGFDSGNLEGGVRPYFVIENSSKAVVVSPSGAAPGSPTAGIAFSPFGGQSGSTTPVENVGLTPAASLAGVQQATLSGTVTISNMINQREFGQLAGNFDSFLSYLPIVWVYDSSGVARGAGMVVPFPPNESGKDPQLKAAVSLGNFSLFQSLMGPAPGGWGPVGYEIRGLTANTTYNLVVTTPNYPPYKTSVLLGGALSTTTINIDLDLNPGETLTGLVQSTAGVALGGAQVTVKADGYGPTTVTTSTGGASGATGSWSLSGLAAGNYQLTAQAAGYAQAVQAVAATGSGSASVPTFSLPAANASLSGTVYTNNPICPPGTTCSAFGKTVLQGITVYAYDDTLNATNPTAPLALYRAVTDSSGTYAITGLSTALIAGTTNYHQFKVFVNAAGYYVLNQSTAVPPGGVTGFDCALKPKPLDVAVFGAPSGVSYEFQITNFRSFSSGNAWVSPAPFSSATSVQLPQSDFVQRVDAQGGQQLFLDIPLSSLTSGTVYDLHIVAQPNDPRAAPVVKDVQFGLNLPHNTCQSIDSALIGDDSGVNAQGLPNNLVPLDISGGAGGNGSGLSLPVGGVIPIFSTAVPSMCMTETDASASTQAAVGTSSGSFASGVYSVTLSSVNYTPKGVDLTLSYTQSGTALNDLAIFTFDNASQQWKSVPGTQTIDPVKGTISVKGLKSLASVLRVGAAGTGLMAATDGRSFRPNALLLRPDDTGIFAIMKPSSLASGAFAGTTVKIYNFPNPFSLESKTVSVNNTATNACSAVTPTSFTTDGTVIKLEVPSNISGHGVLRVYTLSGRLVRELDEGTLAGGNCYYTNWDGRNKNGQPVANGVYYGVLSVAGSKAKDGVFKMAVIK